MKGLSFAVMVVVIILAGLVAFGQGWIGPVAQAQSVEKVTPATAAVGTTQSDSGIPRTITVVGEGSVKIEPDIARVSIGVETVDTSVRVATDQASATMTRIMAALKAAGVVEKDMQTSGFSIWTERDYGPERTTGDEARYRVNNTLNIVVRDLDTVGAVIDAAIEAGANAIHGVSFSIAEPQALEAEARAKATENARAKAAELATLNDVEVGEVISVSEVVGSGGGYLNSNFAYMEAAKAGLGGGAPISPGELELSMRLQVVYAIR
jgi:uncharacterized protein YggE